MNDGMSRREALKLSAAAGITLATGGLATVAAAATGGPTPANRPEHARNQFLKSMNCSQAILETYAPAMGMTVQEARRVAAAFAGGMKIGAECGAVTGALMVIGLKYGKTVESDPAADRETGAKVAELLREFQARHRHLGCSALLGTDMGTAAGIKQAAGKGYFTSRCPEYVRSAAEILERILA